MRADDDAVRIDPHIATAAPAACRARATIQAHHGHVVVIVVKADAPRLLACMGHLQPQSIHIATVGGVLLHIPRFVLGQLDGRRHGGERRELAVRRLQVVVRHIAHHLIARRLGGRRGVLILKRQRNVEHLELPQRWRRCRWQRPADARGPARGAFTLYELLRVNIPVVTAAQMHHLLRCFDHGVRLGGCHGLRRLILICRLDPADRAHRDLLLGLIRHLADFQHTQRRFTRRDLPVDADAQDCRVGSVDHNLRASAIDIEIEGSLALALGDAVRQRFPRSQWRFSRQRCALINRHRHALADAALQLLQHLGRQLLPHHHGYRRGQRLPRVFLDQGPHYRPACRRQLDAFQNHLRAFVRLCLQIRLGPLIECRHFSACLNLGLGRFPLLDLLLQRFFDRDLELNLGTVSHRLRTRLALGRKGRFPCRLLLEENTDRSDQQYC